MVELQDGVTWQQFCGVEGPVFFRSTLNIPTGFDHAASIVLPMPSTIVSPKIKLDVPSLESAMQQHGDHETAEEGSDDAEDEPCAGVAYDDTVEVCS